MRLHRLTLVVFCTVLGAAAGYGIAYTQFHAEVKRSEPADLPRQTPQLEVNAQGPIVVVQLYDRSDKLIRQTTGIVLSNPGGTGSLLLTNAVAFYEAGRADMIAAGDLYSLRQVVALDENAGLVLTTIDYSDTKTLTPYSEVSLYLGRDVKAVTLDNEVDGMVDSPAQRSSSQYYEYEIKLNGALNSRFAALFDTNGDRLIGIVLGGRNSDGHYFAVDASRISALIDSIGTLPAQSIAQFSQSYFQDSLHGLLYRIQLLANTSDWSAIVRLARQLRPGDIAGQKDVTEPLNHAFLNAANSELETGRYDEALSILDEAERLLDLDPVRSRMRAKILFAKGEILPGIDELIRMMDQGIADEASYTMLQSMVLGEVNNGNQTNVNLSELLNQAIAHDPGFAPYHAALGKQLYRQGRYAEALSSFNYATQLDSGLLSELQSLMNAARQRLKLPGQIVVPLQVDGNNILVNVSVNRLRKRFVLDTGASFTVLSANVAGEIGLVTDNATRVMLHTANGVVQAPLVKVESIGLGNAMVSNLEVAVLDNMGPIDGLLGLNFLNHFDIDIDRAVGDMVLRRR